MEWQFEIFNGKYQELHFFSSFSKRGQPPWALLSLTTYQTGIFSGEKRQTSSLEDRNALATD